MRFFGIFSMKLTHLAPNKQAKMVLLKDSFSRRYSRNTVSDCAQANTSQSQ